MTGPDMTILPLLRTGPPGPLAQHCWAALFFDAADSLIAVAGRRLCLTGNPQESPPELGGDRGLLGSAARLREHGVRYRLVSMPDIPDAPCV